MRRDSTCLLLALSSAVLLVAAGDAHVLCHASDFATGGGLATTASDGNTPPRMTVSDSFPISDASGSRARRVALTLTDGESSRSIPHRAAWTSRRSAGASRAIQCFRSCHFPE